MEGEGGKIHVAFAANHFIAVILAREGFERGLDDTASEAEDEVEGGFLQNSSVGYILGLSRYRCPFLSLR